MVKYISDKTGRFPLRPHYQQKEIDDECEQVVTVFLQSLYGVVEFPISTDDITRLIEQRVHYLDPYADLSEFGADVEGLTEFHPGDKPTVQISSRLTEDDRRENRLRTTLTHEFGHVHFHSPLFERDHDQLSLLSVDPQQNIVVCKRDRILDAPSYDWMEWQAGYACGSFLMPKSHLIRCVGEFAAGVNVIYPIETASQSGCDLIELVAERFRVSRDAARVRLSRLKYLGKGQGQTPLF
ncbi:ImmA/IrrE family metallo-endopeptidase [Phormidesmis priestleyi]|uniref:ImmA/IrrE family metallo-endopeptidase n=1 Tax=Phormidesmis priestleyi TaxID=268141 RepID=UPI00083B6C08|nr:ImmA/IrrE family metallo-endopeptidase [Phormidesmis priestleyi]